MGQVVDNGNGNIDGGDDLADCLKSISSESLSCEWVYTIGGEELTLTSQDDQDNKNRHEATKIMNKGFASINDLSNKLKLGPTGDIYGQLSSSQTIYQCGISRQDNTQPILIASGLSKKGDSFGLGLASAFEVRQVAKAFVEANC